MPDGAFAYPAYSTCATVADGVYAAIRQNRGTTMSYYAFEGLIPVVHPDAFVHPAAPC